MATRGSEIVASSRVDCRHLPEIKANRRARAQWGLWNCRHMVTEPGPSRAIAVTIPDVLLHIYVVLTWMMTGTSAWWR